jgi:signal transduction histidine kinase
MVEVLTTPRESVRPVRVMLVDDNAGFRESLFALLDIDELNVVGQAATGAEACDMAADLDPDVVLMDVQMPTMDGVEATRRLKQLIPRASVVALTGNDSQDTILDMLAAGVDGYVLKDDDGQSIVDGVLRVARGEGIISPEVTPTVINELNGALEREHRRMEELERAHEALVERSARRQEQIARLGHELRTPVTVILGMAQTLAKYGAPVDQQEELLERLSARAGDLVRLVERFELAVDAEMTEWIDVVEVAKQIAAENPRLRVEALGRIPAANLNPVVARRLLEEIVDNALRFSEQDRPVNLRIDADETSIRVRVIDRGPGIDPEIQERIFTPLEQGEALNARTHQGTGMGLSLARTAARAAGGDVQLESSGPHGSVFCWRISRRS